MQEYILEKKNNFIRNNPEIKTIDPKGLTMRFVLKEKKKIDKSYSF